MVRFLVLLVAWPVFVISGLAACVMLLANVFAESRPSERAMLDWGLCGLCTYLSWRARRIIWRPVTKPGATHNLTENNIESHQMMTQQMLAGEQPWRLATCPQCHELLGSQSSCNLCTFMCAVSTDYGQSNSFYRHIAKLVLSPAHSEAQKIAAEFHRVRTAMWNNPDPGRYTQATEIAMSHAQRYCRELENKRPGSAAIDETTRARRHFERQTLVEQLQEVDCCISEAIQKDQHSRLEFNREQAEMIRKQIKEIDRELSW